MQILLTLAIFASAFALLPATTIRSAATAGRAQIRACATAPKQIVVVGGGWAGYTAAEALSADSNCRVTLLDASPAAGGLAGGWRTPGGRPVEAGIHGFWREYRNTFAVIDSLGLDRDTILTPFTPSVLVSKNGKVATAPVLATDEEGADLSGKPPKLSPESMLELLRFSPLAGLQQLAAAASAAKAGPLQQLSDLLPAPLDTALLADFAPGSPLTLTDRASAIGLAASWADFGQEDEESWARYDKVSAEELFKRYGGVSDTLYDELVAPLLHVLPMGPGDDISAAAALSCFHVFALQSRGAFDVRWCRGGIGEKIFGPWRSRLEARGNVVLQNGARVGQISRGAAAAEGADNADAASAASGRPLLVQVTGASAEEAMTLEADAVVLAVGATAASRLAEASPALKVRTSQDLV